MREEGMKNRYVFSLLSWFLVFLWGGATRRRRIHSGSIEQDISGEHISAQIG